MKTTITSFMLLMLLALPARAAIVYTDIPDGVPQGLDFNGDGIFEFNIQPDMFGSGIYLTYTLPSNIYSPGQSQWDSAQPLQAGFSIGPSGNWFGFLDCKITGYAHPTTFPLGVDQYIGFRISLGGNTHYGWARVSVAATGPDFYTVTYKDYAYEDTPGTPIAAGDKGPLGTPGFDARAGVGIVPNPATGATGVLAAGGQGLAGQAYEIWGPDGTLKLKGRTTGAGQFDLPPQPGFYLLRTSWQDKPVTLRMIRR